jgi:hypothetical protein
MYDQQKQNHFPGLILHCKKLSKYISQPVPTTGHNPDRYKWISLGCLFV